MIDLRRYTDKATAGIVDDEVINAIENHGASVAEQAINEIKVFNYYGCYNAEKAAQCWLTAFGAAVLGLLEDVTQNKAKKSSVFEEYER